MMCGHDPKFDYKDLSNKCKLQLYESNCFNKHTYINTLFEESFLNNELECAFHAMHYLRVIVLV